MGASRPGADAEDEEEFKIPVKELSEGKKRDYGCVSVSLISIW
jgi:hypothetical protein